MITIPEFIPKFVPAAENLLIALGLPLYVTLETLTPGPKSTFWTNDAGGAPGDVTNWQYADAVLKISMSPNMCVFKVNTKYIT